MCRCQASLVALASAVLLAVCAPRALAETTRPNILYIVADDLGWKDVGYHGSDIRTPNIDALAGTGARLEQFYAMSMCTPTRAALMTGRYPLRYGLQTLVIPASHTYGLPTDEWLMPQALAEAGYSTAIIGKWHIGHGDREFWPRQRGFDYQYGPLIGEIDYFTHKAEGITDWYRDNDRVEEPGYSTTLLGDDAVRYIEARDGATPFYLYLAFNAPHTPYQAPQEYLDRYASIEDPSRRAYAAAITAMDDQIGRVVAALDAKGLRDNTIIVFQSDNGGTRNAMFTGTITDTASMTIPCDNGPYREGKGTNYEGGTRVCAIVNWPGHIAPGVVDGMVHVVDMFPTLAGIAGASTAKCKPLDGINLWPTIAANSPSPRTEIIYNVEPFRAAVRKGDWKLVWRAILPESVELFNIAQDPGEADNRAAEHPEIVATLKTRANQLAAEMVKPKLLLIEFDAITKRLHLPPAFPGEELLFQQEPAFTHPVEPAPIHR